MFYPFPPKRHLVVLINLLYILVTSKGILILTFTNLFPLCFIFHIYSWFYFSSPERHCLVTHILCVCMCVHVCICVCVCACMCLYVDACLCMRESTRAHTHTHTLTHARTHMHISTWTQGNQKLMFDVFFHPSPLCVLKQGFSLNLEITDWLNWPVN